MKIAFWFLVTATGIFVSSIFMVFGFLFRYAKGGFTKGIEFAEKDAEDIFPYIYKKGIK